MTTPSYPVRPARAADLRLIAAVEDAGVAMYEEVLGDLAGDPLASPAPSGAERMASGVLLVAGDPPVGFVHVIEVEWHSHLEQVSVHPDHLREGLGSALVRAAIGEAWHAGHDSITLCTYLDLPWNAPFYAGLGFVVVDEPEPWLREIRRREQALGLDRHGPRVVMRARTSRR